jgi:hypothetical protein
LICEKERVVQELTEALHQVKMLQGLLPICAFCKRIRDDGGEWQAVESYVSSRSEVRFSHGYCPQCVKKYFPEVLADSS